MDKETEAERAEIEQCAQDHTAGETLIQDSNLAFVN